MLYLIINYISNFYFSKNWKKAKKKQKQNKSNDRFCFSQNWIVSFHRNGIHRLRYFWLQQGTDVDVRRSCRDHVVAEKHHLGHHAFLLDKMARMYRALVEWRQVPYRLDRMAYKQWCRSSATTRANLTFGWPQSSWFQFHFTLCVHRNAFFVPLSNARFAQQTFKLDCNKINTALDIHVSEHDSLCDKIIEMLSVHCTL